MSPMTLSAEYDRATIELLMKLRRMDASDTRCGLTRLVDQDRTYGWWLGELQARITALSVLQEPSVEVLDALGALCIALKVRLARQQETQVHSGGDLCDDCAYDPHTCAAFGCGKAPDAAQ